MRTSRLFLCLAVLGCSPAAHAFRISGMLQLGAEFGGESVAEVTYTDGSRSRLEAGNGLVLNLGALAEVVELGDVGLLLHAAAGLKYSTVKDADNGGVDWFRFPLQLLLLAQYKPFSLHLGMGISYQLGSNVAGSGALEPLSMSFQNAPGFIVEAGHIFGESISITARYTVMRIAPTGINQSISANTFGIYLGILWPKWWKTAPTTAETAPLHRH